MARRKGIILLKRCLQWLYPITIVTNKYAMNL